MPAGRFPDCASTFAALQLINNIPSPAAVGARCFHWLSRRCAVSAELRTSRSGWAGTIGTAAIHAATGWACICVPLGAVMYFSVVIFPANDDAWLAFSGLKPDTTKTVQCWCDIRDSPSANPAIAGGLHCDRPRRTARDGGPASMVGIRLLFRGVLRLCVYSYFSPLLRSNFV